MKRLFIADKPGKIQFSKIENLLGKEDKVIIARSITSYFFNYPHNFKYKDLPSTGKAPVYQYNQSKKIEQKYINVIKLTPNSIDQSYHMEDLIYNGNTFEEFNILQSLRLITVSIISGENLYSEHDLELARKKVIDFINQFDEIICISDTILSGVRGLISYFEEYLNIPDFMNTELSQRITYFFPFMEDIEVEYKNRKKIIECPSYVRSIEAFRKKDYFSYNFNINSLVMIGDILRKINCNPTKVFTMRMLQTLILFKSKIKDKNTLEVCTKELFNTRLNSHMADNHTLCAIDEYLTELGFITQKHNGLYNYYLTDKAIQFLDLLHPKMKDPKLSLKVGNDLYDDNCSFDDFKNKYDKKLEMMFKKQKRFSSTRKQI